MGASARAFAAAQAGDTTCGRCIAPAERASGRHGTGPCNGCSPRNVGSACRTPCPYDDGAATVSLP
ncbi:hypothetical protein L810_7105 [Burkholderia sp. AU4i]|nr:hypothetical protein L810_7105 [Burkholderia sp. AU4i]